MRLIQHAQAMNGLGTKNHHDLDPVNLLYCTAQRPTHESNHALRPISSAYGSLFKSPTATYVGFLLTSSAATCKHSTSACIINAYAARHGNVPEKE
jgi:hypothetical protein